MSKRDWCNGAALGLISGGGLVLVLLVWWVGLNYCPNSPCEYSDANGDEKRHYVYDAPLAFGPNTTNVFTEDDQEGDADYYNRQDLRAQESMARATNAIVVWTAAGVLIALIGMGALIVTLNLQRSANKISEKSAKDQSRAYVSAQSAKFYWGNRARTRPRIVIIVANSGHTPAKWYQIRAREFLWGDKDGNHIAPSGWEGFGNDVDFGGKIHAVPVSSEGSAITLDIELTAEEIEKVRSHIFGEIKAGFGIIGQIRYCTFFGEVFVTEFAFGRVGLPDFEVLEERETGEYSGITTKEVIERAIQLKRYSSDLKSFEYVGKEEDYT